MCGQNGTWPSKKLCHFSPKCSYPEKVKKAKQGRLSNPGLPAKMADKMQVFKVQTLPIAYTGLPSTTPRVFGSYSAATSHQQTKLVTVTLRVYRVHSL